MVENEPKTLEYYLNSGPYKTDLIKCSDQLKFMLDGALGSRGALMINDYSDRKGFKGIIRTPIDSIQ